MWRYITQTILAASVIVVAGVLAYGVYEGSLAPGAASEQTLRDNAYGSTGGRGFGDEPDEHGIITVSNDRRTLHSFEGRSLFSGNGAEPQAEIELPARARTIEPTPGGVSVWVTYEGRPEIDIFASETLEHEASVEPPEGRRRNPEYLQFSENGQTLFITWQDSAEIDVYRHEMRELTHRLTIEADGTRGPVHRNRRATRVYRATREGEIAVFFAQNGQRLGDVSPGSLAEGMRFSDDHSLLWGVAGDGRVFAVDEAETTAAESGITVSAGHAPVAAVSHEPGLGGSGHAVFVSDGEAALVRVAVSDLERETSEAAGRLELAQFTEIAGERIVAAVSSGTGAIVLFTDDGEVVKVDPQDLGLREVGRIAAAGEADAERPAAPADDIDLAASYAIRTDGNFACF